jgi:hypothetical protein
MKSRWLILFPLILVFQSALAQGPIFKFSDPVLYLTNVPDPEALVVVDLNGDSKPDLVIGNSDSVSVLLGNGDGTFQTAVTYPGGAAPYSLAVVDMNRDGKLDVVAGTSTSVSVFFGNGDGTFRAAVVTNMNGSGLAVADFDRDGFPDLAVPMVDAIAVFPGNGDGTFRAAIVSPTPLGYYALAAADIDHDGKPDVVMTPDGSAVGIMFGNGDGTFQPPVTYSVEGFNTVQISVMDADGDGWPDILVVHERAQNVFKGVISLLLNNRHGGFPQGSGEVFSGNPYVAAAGNLVGDGGGDVIAVTTHGGALFLASGFRHFAIKGDPLAIADLNGDGQADIISLVCAYEDCSSGAAAVRLSEGVDSKTVLTGSLNPSQSGQPVTFTAYTTSARGGVPAGILVTFFDGSHEIGTAVTIWGIGASFTTSALTAGTHSIKAEFPGCPYVKKSKGTVKQVVNP